MSIEPNHGRRPVRPARTARFGNAFAFLLLAFALVAGAAQAAEPQPLDVNRATAAQLEALPGIGAVKAAAILAVREERGGFRSLAELESVRGIGPKLAVKLRSLLTIGVRKPTPKNSPPHRVCSLSMPDYQSRSTTP